MSIVDIVVLLVGTGTLIAALLQIRETRRQPLTAAELQAADDLRSLSLASQERLMELVRGDSNERADDLATIKASWKKDTEYLRPRLSFDLEARVDALTTFLDVAGPLRSYEQTGEWMEACYWACFDVQYGAEAHARLRPGTALRVFPSANEVRELLAKGQSLQSGLEELRRQIARNAMAVITDEAKANRRKGLLIGAQLGASAVLLVVAIIRIT